MFIHSAKIGIIAIIPPTIGIAGEVFHIFLKIALPKAKYSTNHIKLQTNAAILHFVSKNFLSFSLNIISPLCSTSFLLIQTNI